MKENKKLDNEQLEEVNGGIGIRPGALPETDYIDKMHFPCEGSAPALPATEISEQQALLIKLKQ